MTEREQNLEGILKELLTQHFFGASLEWGHRNDITLQDAGLELYLKIAKEIPDVILFHKS